MGRPKKIREPAPMPPAPPAAAAPIVAPVVGAGRHYFVYSTLSTDQAYTKWQPNPDAPIPKDPAQNAPPPIKVCEILIRGNYGMADEFMRTSLGQRTEISAEQLAILETIPVFVAHRKRGFITVKDAAHDVEKVVADMARSDRSMPITPSHFANAGEDAARPMEGKVPRVYGVERLDV